jgi:AcrR family transcriptional regulator
MTEHDARTRILEAAEELFAAKGYAGATVREIGAAAGTNLAMIHYYFGNKEGLYRAIFEEKVAEMQRIIADTGAAASTNRERLERFVHHYASFMCTQHRFARLLQQELLSGSSALHEVLRPQVAKNYAVLNGILRDGVESGEFRPIDVSMTPVSLVGAIAFVIIAQPLVAGVLGSCLTDEGFSDRLANHTLDLCLHGILDSKEDAR